MPLLALPVGSYNIVANGASVSGGLTITSVDSAGGLSGTISGQPITGLYEQASDRITFLRVMAPDLSQFQTYDGRLYGFSTATNQVTYTLAGIFQEFDPSTDQPGPAAFFPWSAQLVQKAKEKEKEKEKEAKEAKEKEKEKEKEAKEAKETKEVTERKELDKVLEGPAAMTGDPTGMLGQLAARLDNLEQRVAIGQAFIGREERPDVGGQMLQEGEAGAGE
jgi:hypothetical protein